MGGPDKTRQEISEELMELRQRNTRLEDTLRALTKKHEELRRVANRWELALEGAEVGAWDYNLETGEAFVSPRRAAMLGYSVEELEPHLTSWGKLVHPDDLTRVRKAFNAHVKGRTPFYECEHRLRCKSGEYIWVLARGKIAERDKSGNPIRLVGTSLDITDRKRIEEALQKAHDELDLRVEERTATLNEMNESLVLEIAERKRAEDALRQSEEKYRLMFEHSPLGVFHFDNTGKITACNDNFVRIIGSSRERLIGLDTMRNLKDEKIIASIKKALSGGMGHYEDYYRSVTADKITPVKCDFGPIVSQDGTVVGGIGIIEDITDRKRSQDELKRLYAAVEQAGETIVVTDPSGSIQYVNPSFEVTTGYKREEALGSNPRILKSGKHEAAFYQRMWETLLSGEVWRGRFTNKKKDGTLYEETATISPIKDEHGSTVSYVAVKRDITAETMLQKQLIHAQKMEAIGTLAGGMAHDFNNLLMAILGYSDLLLQRKERDDPEREKLGIIKQAAKDGADLVKGILTFSKRVEPRTRRVNLNTEIRRNQKLLLRTLPRMIKIELVLSDDLEDIGADPVQIDQVLLNLAVNAGHAMPEGGRLLIETMNVILTEDYCERHLDVPPGKYALLAVTDTGTGIEPEVLDRVFEPFFTTKSNGEGTGLGLSMVHGIVAQHGGHIMCYSERGVGTTFKIYLPVAANNLLSDVTLNGEMPAFGTETILLVDDDERVRDLALELISLAGYTVLTATNGAEALDKYRMNKEDISLVILDMIMPGMSGKRCLEELLKIDPTAKVLVSSGYSVKGPIKDAVSAGARGFISKPYDAKEILRVIRTILDEGHL